MRPWLRPSPSFTQRHVWVTFTGPGRRTFRFPQYPAPGGHRVTYTYSYLPHFEHGNGGQRAHAVPAAPSPMLGGEATSASMMIPQHE